MQQRNGATHENARGFTMNINKIKDIVGNAGTQNILTVSGVKEEQGFIEITKDEYPHLYKIVSKCASLTFGLNERYLSSSEDELRALIKGLPRFINDCTFAQAALCYQVGNELNRRIAEERSAAKKSITDEYAEFERTGLWDNGKPFPQVGDTVEYVSHGYAGCVEVFAGKVIKKKDGSFAVRYKDGISKGGKLTKLTYGWVSVKK